MGQTITIKYFSYNIGEKFVLGGKGHYVKTSITY